MIAPRINALDYAIRIIAAKARELEKRGKSIIKLHIGDPLKFDFEVPEVIKKALAKHADKGFYGPTEGIEELRVEISKWEARKGVKVEPQHIYLTQGLSEAINGLLACLAEPGTEILLPSPVYSLYLNYTKFYGAKPVFYDAINPSLDEVAEKINEKTRAMVVINPNNPTGVVYGREFIKGVAELAEEQGIIAIFDEIYDLLTFDVKTVNAGLFVNENLVILNGFSKIFLVPGYRLGYAYFFGNKELEEAFVKFLRVRLSTNMPAQFALLEAMKEGGSWIPELVEKLRERRDIAYKRIKEIGFEVKKPEGAFYIFPRINVEDDWRFAFDLLERGVALVPGSGFGRKGYIRIVYLAPPELLNRAFDIIENYVKEHA